MQRWRFACLASIACGVGLFASWASAQDKPQDGHATVIGAWTGTYTCPQGLTGLTLSINAQNGETFSGYFHFYPPAADSDAREGCYSVRGRIDPQRRISVVAVRWMTQPEGYVTVDLAGQLDAAGGGMAGAVVAPSPIGAQCTTFALKAQVPAPRISGLCHAGVASAADAPRPDASTRRAL